MHDIIHKILREIERLKEVLRTVSDTGLEHTTRELEMAIKTIGAILPILDDILTAANTKIVAQAAQITSLTTQLATAVAAQSDPVLGVDPNTVPAANTLGTTLGIAPLDGTPLSQQTPPAGSGT